MRAFLRSQAMATPSFQANLHAQYKKLRRSIKLAVQMVMTFLLIVSCQQTAPLPNQPVTLKLSGWSASPAEQRLLNQVLKDFEATHPAIKVRFEVIADQYMDVIKTRLIGDAAPDVFYLDSIEAPFLIQQNVLEPLDAYITPAFDLADFEPNLLQTFAHQNQVYGLPKDYSTLALFYNRKAFAAAGLTQPPETWEDLLVAAKKLTIDRNQDNRPDQYGLGILPELPRQMHSIEAFGGQVVDAQSHATFATAAGIKGTRLALLQYRDDRTSARAVDVGANNGSEMFGQGKAAMVIEGNWAIPYLQETFPDLDFATAEAPKINNKPATMVFTVAYVMNRQTQHKQAAWELIAYLTGKEGMGKWTSTGFALPSRKSVAKELAQKFSESGDPCGICEAARLRAPLLAGVSYATPWQIGNYPAAIVNNFNNQYLSALLGQQPLEAAIVKAQESANQQIEAAL
jgi:multiple sugar transport system substrate-binding protein